MADDHPQRPFRNTELQSRATPTASNPPAGHNDPLAELARLIGQNDPFGEFGRERRPPAAAPAPRSSRPPRPVMPRTLPSAPPGAPHPAVMPPRPAAFGAEDLPASPMAGRRSSGAGEVYHTERRCPATKRTRRPDARRIRQPSALRPIPAKSTISTTTSRRRAGAWAFWRSPRCSRWRSSAPPAPTAIARCSARSAPARRRSSRPTPSRARSCPTRNSQSSKLINDRVNDRSGDRETGVARRAAGRPQ